MDLKNLHGEVYDGLSLGKTINEGKLHLTTFYIGWRKSPSGPVPVRLIGTHFFFYRLLIHWNVSINFHKRIVSLVMRLPARLGRTRWAHKLFYKHGNEILKRR